MFIIYSSADTAPVVKILRSLSISCSIHKDIALKNVVILDDSTAVEELMKLTFFIGCFSYEHLEIDSSYHYVNQIQPELMEQLSKQ